MKKQTRGKADFPILVMTIILVLFGCIMTVSYTHLDVYKRQILDMDAAGVLEKVKDTSKYEIWLKRQITQDQADQIRALDLPGVDFAVDTKRYYPKGDLLTQVLGFTSVDGEGLEGLESYYNKYLTGTAGSTVSETDVKGNNVAFGEQYYDPPTDGYTVQPVSYTHLDVYKRQAMW